MNKLVIVAARLTIVLTIPALAFAFFVAWQIAPFNSNSEAIKLGWRAGEQLTVYLRSPLLVSVGFAAFVGYAVPLTASRIVGSVLAASVLMAGFGAVFTLTPNQFVSMHSELTQAPDDPAGGQTKKPDANHAKKVDPFEIVTPSPVVPDTNKSDACQPVGDEHAVRGKLLDPETLVCVVDYDLLENRSISKLTVAYYVSDESEPFQWAVSVAKCDRRVTSEGVMTLQTPGVKPTLEDLVTEIPIVIGIMHIVNCSDELAFEDFSPPSSDR